ncbi:hypothetical protein HU200_020844 [Digitaria exilis]|uniref:Cytochrome P450 n=1 Tax=Digitaria exilis TaxID=1010633 RepID=A0A835KA94_9POAL|nr:hypothetical protein HU200_020844 [Digitaria exilis]
MAQSLQGVHQLGVHEIVRGLPPRAALVFYSLLLACSVILLLLRRRRLATSCSAAARAREQLLSKLPSPPRRLPVIGHLHLVGALPHVSLRDLAAEHSRDGLMLLRLGAVPTLVVSPPLVVRLVMAKIHKAAGVGMVVDLSSLLNSFTNNIVCHAVSGKFYREEGRNELFRELVEANSSLMGGFNIEDYFPSSVKLDMIKRMLCAKAQKVNKRWNELLDKLIDDHERRSASQHGDEENDFIDVLLSIQEEYKLTRDHIKAQLEIMFEAATDTSFIVLEYAMIMLMQNPDVMAKLQTRMRMTIPKGKEMVTEDDLNANDMDFLKAVIKETLRLHAPAPLLAPHLSMADCDIEGYTIPSGTRVIVNAWALARDPSQWERAEEFMPERFMEDGSAFAIDYRGNYLTYLPFGTGRRICPGIRFAISSIEIMLANLVYHFNWALPLESKDKGIDMSESFGVTVHRREKLLLVPVLPQ